MKAHEIDYRIIGDDIQLVEIVSKALAPYCGNRSKEDNNILGNFFVR